MGKSSGGSTTTQEMDPDIKNILLNNYKFAQDVAGRDYQAYNGQRVAGFDPQQNQAFKLMDKVATGKGYGQQDLGDAALGAKQVMNQEFGKRPIDVDPAKTAQDQAATLGEAVTNDAALARAADLGGPATAQASTGTAAALADPAAMKAVTGQAAKVGRADMAGAALAGPAASVDAAHIDPNKVSGVDAGRLTDLNLNRYMNPYDDQVVNQGTADLNRARQMIQNDIGSQASHVGAAFGSRQAVAEAENNRNFLQQVAQLSAQNRQAGYGQAAGQAQADLDRALQAQTTQQGADLTLQGKNQDYLQQARTLNAAARNEQSQFNANQKQAVGLANQQATNQFALQDAANRQATHLADLGYLNEAAGRNQDAENQFALQNGANQQQMSLANLGYLNEASGRNQDASNQFALQRGADQQQVNVLNAQARNQVGAQNQDALNQFLLQQGAYDQQTGLANQDAMNQSAQFNANLALQQAIQNQQNALQGAQIKLSGANSLADMAMQKQQMGMADVQGLLGTGQLQQQQSQALLDQKYQDYLNKWNYPLQQLQILEGGAQPLQQSAGSTTTTETKTSPWGTLGNLLGIASMFGL